MKIELTTSVRLKFEWRFTSLACLFHTNFKRIDVANLTGPKVKNFAKEKVSQNKNQKKTKFF